MSESQVDRIERPESEAGGVLEDGTLGGYLDAHERPPAFEGPDRHPYTVSVEVEKVADLRAPFASYLVFPRWAMNAMGIVGHVETPLLGRARSRDAARRIALELSLVEVQRLLDEAVGEARGEDGEEWSSFPPSRSGADRNPDRNRPRDDARHRDGDRAPDESHDPDRDADSHPDPGEA